MFTKTIKDNERDYLAFLSTSIDQLREINDQTSELELDTVIKIFSQINLQAEEYLEYKDFDRFDFQYSNLASEIINELDNQWESYIISNHLTTINSLQNSQEAALDILGN